MNYSIHIELLSDTTFARGDGTAGEVDVEIGHDDLGLPVIPGKTISGLLRESWLCMAPMFPADEPAAVELLGEEGTLMPASNVHLRLDTATLGDDAIAWIRYATTRPSHPMDPGAVLRGFTDVRRQTARDRATGGAPEAATLRATRVALRGLCFTAPIRSDGFTHAHWRTLAKMCLGVRHAGLRRNRGRGFVRLSLHEDGADITERELDT